MTTTAVPVCVDVLVDEGLGDPAQAEVHTLELEGSADAPKAARLFAWGAAPPLDDDAMAVLSLLTSELVTNAVLHARTPITYCLVVTDTMVLVVTADANPALPAPTPAGRGLQLVASIARDWGVRPVRDGGKAVWFTISRS